jgi:hypothetical protein
LIFPPYAGENIPLGRLNYLPAKYKWLDSEGRILYGCILNGILYRGWACTKKKISRMKDLCRKELESSREIRLPG